MTVYILLNEDGKAYNRIVLESPESYAVPAGHSVVLASEAPANLQWVKNAAAMPQSIPSITRLQFLLAAPSAGLLTSEQAEQASLGEIPLPIQAVFDTLPEAEAAAARVIWRTMTRIERNEPLVAEVAAAQGMTSEQVDAFFVAAAAI
jgi:ABC-type proline/glycine betaine transport system permease subunit